MTVQRFVAHGLLAVDSRYLFLQRREGRYLGGYWDIPGGTVEVDETPANAAARECVEETDIICTIGDELSHFENMDTGGRDINFHTVTYQLIAAAPNPAVRISDEHQAYRWTTVRDAAALELVWHVRRTLELLDGRGHR